MPAEANTATRLWTYLKPLRGAMLEAVEDLVTRESPSLDKPALDALAGRLAGRFEALDGAVERVSNGSGGDHLRVRFGRASDPTPPALLLAHFDTVWPAGTLARMPFRTDGVRAYGPGVHDMKSSIVLIEFALRALQDLGLEPPRPVVLVLTSDEEIGSPTSRRLIEESARGCAHVLVVEPPLADGGLKTARKGVGRFTVEVAGRAAHAGVEPEKGVSAVVELAHHVLALHALADPAAGTTVNVGVIRGGTTWNVVPAEATASVDVRASTLGEARRIESAMAELRPSLPGARVAVTGGFNRPPMERTPAVAALFERARQVGRSLGLELTEGSTGGGSDGNFTAALGVPTLDGLGVPGGGAHADHEHILIDSLPQRAALLAALLLELEGAGNAPDRRRPA
jgi:glutamate carboxypeptidase